MVNNNGELNIKRIGYKGFNRDENGNLYCRDMRFKVGEIAEVPGKPVICEHGIHFCWNLNDVNHYYNIGRSVICEVEPLGDIVSDFDGEKCCTNKLKIIRMLTNEEVLRISNTGIGNTGFINTGHYNTGNYNTGNKNAGGKNTGHYNTGHGNTGFHNSADWNTGDYNTGSYNTGNYNTGYDNTGLCNTGNKNAGYYNSGDWNAGCFNSSDYNAGFFNTQSNKCYIFDKLSDMTVEEFVTSKYWRAVLSAPFILTEWIEYTDKEKATDKDKELIGGYLKKYSYKEACKNWWKKLTPKAKQTIQKIPGFTKAKFKEITGITIRAAKKK